MGSLEIFQGVMVRKGGLEPPRFYPPDPKSGASANSATFAQIRLTRINRIRESAFSVAKPTVVIQMYKRQGASGCRRIQPVCCALPLPAALDFVSFIRSRRNEARQSRVTRAIWVEACARRLVAVAALFGAVERCEGRGDGSSSGNPFSRTFWSAIRLSSG